MTTPNRHAALMRQYMEDLILDPFAYRNWELQLEPGSPWTPLILPPQWESDREYRRKPKTVTIGGIEVPEPMRVAPAHGSVYYMPCLTYTCPSTHVRWVGCDYDISALKNGLCHSTKDAAETHTKAIIIASGGRFGE